jgi:acetylornithine deacetylase/succinyl-diaminopimelate desuccinylase-like protein
VTSASEAMAQRLRSAGFDESDLKVLGPNERKKNLVVRLRGRGAHKPVLLIGHLDVVEARREDWNFDPFKFVEQNDTFYGRGTQDMKDGDAVMVTTLIRLNSVTRRYYERMATIETGQRAADISAILATPPDPAAEIRLSTNPGDNSAMHTTCVATRLDAGHANNALPQRARATINCRILPGHSPEEVRQTLIGVLADPSLTVQYIDDAGQLRDTASGKTGNPPPPHAHCVLGQRVVITMASRRPR